MSQDGPTNALGGLIGKLKAALPGQHANDAPARGAHNGGLPEPDEVRQDEVDKPRPLPGDQPPPK